MRKKNRTDKMLSRYLHAPEAVPRNLSKTSRTQILDAAKKAASEPESLSLELTVKPGWRRSFVAVGFSVAVVVAFVLTLHFEIWPSSALARFSTGQRIQPGEVVRTNADRVALTLTDGSRIEMRSQSELFLDRSNDGVRIHLIRGDVIVSAAKQDSGHHLYVLTRDATVSVVGTVFVVKAEEKGSRVAVIEGEVRVQQGNLTKNLLPGEQLLTNPSMESPTVKEEVAWSQSAPEHVAQLQRSVVPPPLTRLEFAAASIKLIPADTTIPGSAGGLRGGGLGLACHGTDGVQRVLLTFTQAGQSSVTAPQGRCVGNGVFLSTLIEFAYGIQARHVSGGPDWARTNPFIAFDEAGRGATVLGGSAYTGADGFKWKTDDSFQILTTADDPSTTTLQQLKQMLQTMLADRFKLTFHRASSVVSGYALIVADKKSKLKPAAGDFEESAVPHKGKSTTEKFAQTLGKAIEAPVIDRTGLAGAFDYEFHMFPPPNSLAAMSLRGGGPLTAADRVEILSSALEEQLGLRLVPEKTIAAETFVIDSVELPTAN